MRENLIDDKLKTNLIVDKEAFNKSVYFVLPMVGLDSTYFSLINVYLGDSINQPDFTFNKIFMNCKYNDEKLRGLAYYNTEYKLPDKTWMYVFNIPEQFAQDYLLFCQGKYSEFSTEYKDQILRLINVKAKETTIVYNILYKTDKRRKYIEDLVGESIGNQEVCSKPDLNKECKS